MYKTLTTLAFGAAMAVVPAAMTMADEGWLTGAATDVPVEPELQ